VALLGSSLALSATGNCGGAAWRSVWVFYARIFFKASGAWNFPQR